MTAKQPIDYARAESADVVRKKHRRRVVGFVVATVVVMVVGGAWPHSWQGGLWLIGNSHKSPVSLMSSHGWIILKTYVSKTTSNSDYPYGGRDRVENQFAGIRIIRFNWSSAVGWEVRVRYRTLFTLAMIPWIITLIRLIRSWRRKRGLEAN